MGKQWSLLKAREEDRSLAPSWKLLYARTSRSEEEGQKDRFKWEGKEVGVRLRKERKRCGKASRAMARVLRYEDDKKQMMKSQQDDEVVLQTMYGQRRYTRRSRPLEEGEYRLARS